MSAIFTFLLAIVAPLAIRLLIGIGCGWAVYTGLDVGMSTLSTQIMSSYNGLSIDVLNVLNLAGVGVVINTLLTSYSVSAILKGLNAAGVFTRFKISKPI